MDGKILWAILELYNKSLGQFMRFELFQRKVLYKIFIIIIIIMFYGRNGKLHYISDLYSHFSISWNIYCLNFFTLLLTISYIMIAIIFVCFFTWNKHILSLYTPFAYVYIYIYIYHTYMTETTFCSKCINEIHMTTK